MESTTFIDVMYGSIIRAMLVQFAFGTMFDRGMQRDSQEIARESHENSHEFAERFTSNRKRIT